MFIQTSHYDSIAAMIPTYTPEGDITTVIATNGHQQKVKGRVRTVLNRLARSYSTDLVALKEKVTLATERSLLQPLPLAPGLVLFPLKLRLPRVSGDQTTGYINFHSVIDVVENHIPPYHSTIRLIGGTEIPVLWTTHTVKQHLQQARLAISYTAYDPEIPPDLSIHIYHAIKGLCRLASFRHSPH
ncbi:hypothetical protein [Pelosinus sp. sgz500959]|uniref:hypothetical protein n=1 Tax=Pelosinus sp. sgz500959 TaxID=3242472 RepID=UPI00366DA93C